MLFAKLATESGTSMSNTMNNINNNQDIANKIYLDHFNKLQQIDFLMETLEQELINIKNETENIIKDN